MATEIKLCTDDDPLSEVLRNIRVYGTYENPLFLAKDVEAALGLKNLNYSNDDAFAPYHKCRVDVPTHRGVRSMVALTECGLYKAIFRSHVAAAESFQYYVYCVLKRLRVDGAVSREQALADREALSVLKQDLQIASQSVRVLNDKIALLETSPPEPVKCDKRHKAIYIVGPEDEGDYKITNVRPKSGFYQEVQIPYDVELDAFNNVETKSIELYMVIDQIYEIAQG